MEKRNVIELKNAAKYYNMGENIVKALDGVDIKIEEGDFVAIMGPSGSGKSTGMNLAGSLDHTTKGEVYLDGENIALLEESELAQIRGKKIGFIFQQFNLIPNLTAKENVMLPMLFQNTLEEEREERAEELLRLLGLSDRESHYPNELSGGQQQRVAIARSLANNPEVILADEPTGNLDSKSAQQVLELFRNLNKENGQTFVLVSHNPKHSEIADRVANLIDGQIESDRNPSGSGAKAFEKGVGR